MAAYYNEIDPYAAQWLRNLISAGHIAPGDVDERSISDIQPDELAGYEQCHFFAGIGGWSYALKLAGWPDDRPVWTGSCPCQPFSVAGKRAGFDDERHLWPDWRWLIDQCRPATIFGEQVASKDGRTWLSGVRSDLETMGYAVGAADLCAASIGAPHIRQRLWFVADSSSSERERWTKPSREKLEPKFTNSGIMGNTIKQGLERQPRAITIRDKPGRLNQEADGSATATGCGCGVGDAGYRKQAGLVAELNSRLLKKEREKEQHPIGFTMPPADWSELQWLPCADGKARPIKPGIEPLAHGVSGRVGQLRAYGNAIVPQVAAEFVKAYIECRP